MEDNFYGIRRILYTEDRKITLIKDHTFRVSKGTIEVQLLCNGYAIVRQFLIPFNNIYHLLSSDFVKEVKDKDKDWYINNIYVFFSFTLRDNILLNNLPYKETQNSKDIDDDQYIDLYSITYELGDKNVRQMYNSFLDMIKAYKIKIGKIAYVKVHRLTNPLNTIRLVEFNKFKNYLERNK